MNSLTPIFIKANLRMLLQLKLIPPNLSTFCIFGKVCAFISGTEGGGAWEKILFAQVGDTVRISSEQGVVIAILVIFAISSPSQAIFAVNLLN